ncbi:hypothetical protein [Dapis sp. BLCC M229]|uniref:hypothetical protein n=1 Tax=Dapis sp. BLCC M229 TaxID=3400188 RepID=UPI003CEDE348
MTQNHPFGKSTPELLKSLQTSQVERNPLPNNSTVPITTLALGEEGGNTTEAFDNSESGGDPIATTLAIGEEGGLSEPIPTTVATEEEGGNSPVPTTATLGAEAGITPIALPPGVGTTQAIGEEGGFAPVPTPTTLAVGEEGGDGATTETLGEEGGSPIITDDRIITQVGTEEGIATTLAIGEEGGVTTLALGEEGGDFNEEIYRQSYPSVNVAINRGELNSGLEHYVQFGEFEIQRIGFFTGTNGNDIITAFGNNTRIVGVNTLGYDVINDRIIPNNLGVGEIDILIGSSEVNTADKFILGSSEGVPFYLGFGNLDFAVIKNFDVAFDQIQLPGTMDDYSVEILNNSVNISTLSGDLIAIIEQVQSLDNLRINFL